jgi:hypothetical protein
MNKDYLLSLPKRSTAHSIAYTAPHGLVKVVPLLAGQESSPMGEAAAAELEEMLVGVQDWYSVLEMVVVTVTEPVFPTVWVTVTFDGAAGVTAAELATGEEVDAREELATAEELITEEELAIGEELAIAEELAPAEELAAAEVFETTARRISLPPMMLLLMLAPVTAFFR